MRKLSLLGATLIGVAGCLGTACGDDDDTGAATGGKGGVGATTAGAKATGGKSTGGSGVITGGKAGGGGTAGGGGRATGGTVVTGGGVSTGGVIAAAGSAGITGATGGLATLGGAGSSGLLTGGTSGAGGASGGVPVTSGAGGQTGGVPATSGAAGAASGAITPGGAGGATGGVTAAGAGGTAGLAPTGGTGGLAGTGGSAQHTLYDFENDVQSWQAEKNNASDPSPDTIVALSTDRAFSGTHSLKISLPYLDSTSDNDARQIDVNSPPLYAGSVVTFHVYAPSGAPALKVGAFSQINNWNWNGGAQTTLAPGGWVTFSYTIPSDMPGGLQQLGIVVGLNKGTGTASATDIYLDDITVVDGPAQCARPASAAGGAAGAGSTGRSFDFEPPVPTDDSTFGWDSTSTGTALAVSDSHGENGGGALEVTFTDFSSGTRDVYLEWPQLYCGDQVTLNVWAPAESQPLSFKAVVQYNGWSGWKESSPDTVVWDDWTTWQLTVPTIGAGGVQRLMIEFTMAAAPSPSGSAGAAGMAGAGGAAGTVTGAAGERATAGAAGAAATATSFTGEVYIDAVSW